ncbi:MAG: LysR family transcriptional regulator [Desulfobacteraceae bacterium]|nr:LysR family transcriptional regulator [Desulfobacteraceae bacterium]
MRVNLNQLRSFFLVAREGSITKAAEALYVTQPAVTMQIKALEQDLDLRLFRKIGKHLEMSDAGRILFAYAERIFEIVEEMEYTLKGYAGLTQGSLVIGTTRSFARHLMPGLISRFQARYPQVKIYLKVGSTQHIADGLLEYKYDLSIIGRLPYRSKLNVVPYTKEEFCLVVAAGHPFAKRDTIALAEIKTESLIIREEGSGSRYAILLWLSSFDVTPSVLMEAESVEFIKEYTIKNQGIAFLYKPEIELEERLGLLKTVKIKEGPILIQTDIVFRRDADLSPPAKAFLELIESGEV